MGFVWAGMGMAWRGDGSDGSMTLLCGASASRVEERSSRHRSPMKRGLVLEPRQWRLSGGLWYALGEMGACGFR